MSDHTYIMNTSKKSSPRNHPPERVIEVEPAPRPGYIWARGYWHWNGQRFVPVHGHWEAERPGYHYVHPHWESAGDGWHWHAGVWLN